MQATIPAWIVLDPITLYSGTEPPTGPESLMSTHTALEPASPWVHITATAEDWDVAEADLLINMFSQLSLIRAFEEYVLGLAGEGLVHGPAHSRIGQEGGAVGSVAGADPSDTVNGSHRGHHQFLAKALVMSHPRASTRQRPVRRGPRLLREPWPKSAGCRAATARAAAGPCICGGARPARSAPTPSSAAGVPLAVGPAWAHRYAGTDRGGRHLLRRRRDQHRLHIGIVQSGRRLEAARLLLHREQPVCGLHHRRGGDGEPRLSARGLGFGIPSWKVDGMDILAVHLAMTEAVAHMRAGHGPAMIEADVYRYFHQNGPFPGSAFGYRTKDEEKSWRDRDPSPSIGAHLMRRGILSRDQADRLAPCASQAMMADVAAEMLEPLPGGKPGQRRIKPAEWPDPDFRDVGVRGDLSEFADAAVRRRARPSAAPVEQRSSSTPSPQSWPGGWSKTPDRHPRRGHPPAQRRHQRRHPRSERKLSRPGAGHPHQRERLHRPGRRHRPGRPLPPVVEFMYADFMWVAADQLFNQIAKARHMFGGDNDDAARAAQQGGDGHRLRLAAFHGSCRAYSPPRRAGASSLRRRRSITSV